MHLMKLLPVAGLCLALSLGALVEESSANAFANGGFETPGVGTPADAWLEAASGYSLSNDAFSGSFALELASPATNAAIALQNSIEQGGQPPLNAGDELTFSFYSKGFAGTTGNVLFALRYLDAGGTILYDSGSQFFQGDINDSTWTQISLDAPAVPVGAVAAFVEFSQAIGPINGTDLLAGSVLIDEVSLSSTIPEPASLSLLGLAGASVLLRRRRR